MTIEQIDELIERLTELIDFAESNIWEVPIDMPDTLDLAITGLQELKQWHKLLSVEVGYPVAPKELKRAVDLEKLLERW